jgi:uncharacterized protein (TIGR03382 family)
MKLLSPLLFVAALCALPALAARDMYGLGIGTTPLTVNAPDTVINAYAQVTAPLLSGDTTIKVSSTAGFAAGKLVMVHQSTGLLPPFPNSSDPFPLPANDTVGRWELARLTEVNVSEGMLTLDFPLVSNYASNVTQVILVPEHTDVTVTSNGVLTAQAWNGSTGGILAFLAKGNVRVDGAIVMNGKGFQGGLYVADTAATPNKGCTGEEEAPRGAQKGEGIVKTAYGPASTGRNRVANAGGGGVCLRSGGGGGGNRGAGGKGGNTDSSEDAGRVMGGDGGTVLLYDRLTRLTFGGGGGAGHSTATLAPNLGGGTGGGIIFIRATTLKGTGTITANGGQGVGDPSILTAGGNGGGAGGSIYLRFASLVECYVEVQGGEGSSTRASAGRYLGPGGGGGGGRALLQSTSGNSACILDVAGANPGQTSSSPPSGDRGYGAIAGGDGQSEVIPSGFPTTPLPAPVVTTPANGSRVSDTTPRYAGTISVSPALPVGTVVFVYVDGHEVGSTPIDASGNWGFEPAHVLSPGSHKVYAVAVNGPEAVGSEPSGTNTFFLDTTPPAVEVQTPAEGSRTHATPTYSGTVSDDGPGPLTVMVSVDGGPPVAATVTGNTWSYTPTVPLASGPHTVTATATDAAGNTTTDSNNFTVDAAKPTVEVQTPAEGSRTRNTLPAYSGTVSDNGPGPLTVMISVDGGSAVAATVTGNTWSYTPTVPLAPGPHTVTATARDDVGNTATDSNAFTVDTAAPTVEVQTPAEGSRTNDTTPTYSGTVSDDGPGPLTVMVSVDGGSAVAATVTGNTWSYTPTEPLALGSHTVTVTATDDLGHSASDSNTFTVEADTKAPDTTIISGPEGTTSSPNATFDFDTDEPGVTYECSLDGGEFTACTDPDTFEDLAEGEHTLVVRARDNAGNVDSTPASRTWNYRRPLPDRDFLGDGIGCAASGGTPSALAMMGLAVLSALLVRRRQR